MFLIISDRQIKCNYYILELALEVSISAFNQDYVYEVVKDRYVKEGRVFATIEPGEPDGFRTDVHGNIFTSSADSVQVYAPNGICLGKIFVPEVCTNLTFGGREKNRLFITAKTSLYAIALNTRGVQKP